MIPRTVANRFANRMGVDLHIAQQEVVLLYALTPSRPTGSSSDWCSRAEPTSG